jgi:hypothetical protein
LCFVPLYLGCLSVMYSHATFSIVLVKTVRPVLSLSLFVRSVQTVNREPQGVVAHSLKSTHLWGLILIYDSRHGEARRGNRILTRKSELEKSALISK